MLLVEGADLAALDNRLYVRTIAGLKRIDAVWNRLPPRLIDPLAFDSHSQIGVPGLIDACPAPGCWRHPRSSPSCRGWRRG